MSNARMSRPPSCEENASTGTEFEAGAVWWRRRGSALGEPVVGFPNEEGRHRLRVNAITDYAIDALDPTAL